MSSAIIRLVTRAMERIAPLKLAGSWDNVGLILESPVKRPNPPRVLLTIDLTTAVCAEAIQKKVSMIVSYHTPIFSGLKSFTLANPLQASLLRCASEGISVYSPHSSLDATWGGINDWLAEGVLDGASGTVRSFEDSISPEGKNEGGTGRVVTFQSPESLDTIVERIKRHLKLDLVQVASACQMPNPITTVGICAGQGSSLLCGKNVDVYFTGEMLHHEVLATVAAGRNVVMCGHTNTERGYLPTLASRLSSELEADSVESSLGPVEILISEMDRHPLDFV